MNDVSFIHLKTRSHYSILEGSITVSDLIDNAINYNMPALALTDNCNLFGAMEFSQLAILKGIQPINGSIVNIVTQDIDSLNNSNFEITLLVTDYILLDLLNVLVVKQNWVIKAIIPSALAVKHN